MKVLVAVGVLLAVAVGVAVGKWDCQRTASNTTRLPASVLTVV